MAGKRDKPEEIVAKLRQVEVLQGHPSFSNARYEMLIALPQWYLLHSHFLPD